MGSLEGTAHSTTPRSAPGDFLLLSCLETAGAEGRRSVEARTVNRAHQTPVLLLQREMCITMATVAKDAQSWVPQMGRRLGDHADPVPTPPLPPLSPALAEALIWHSSSSPAMLRQGEELWGMRGRQRLGLRVLQCQSPESWEMLEATRAGVRPAPWGSEVSSEGFGIYARLCCCPQKSCLTLI